VGRPTCGHGYFCQTDTSALRMTRKKNPSTTVGYEQDEGEARGTLTHKRHADRLAKERVMDDGT